MRMLRVHANPYVAVDHNGQLCGTCPTHSIEGGHTPHRREFVGAGLDREATKVTKQGNPIELREHAQDTAWSFSLEAVEVPATSDFYYLQRIIHGDLIPADKATADYASLKFEEPSIVFARKRSEAIARWVAAYGEQPAFASDPCPMSPQPAAPKSKAPAALVAPQGDK